MLIKKITMLILILVFVIALCACNATATASAPSLAPSADSTEPAISVSFGYADGLRYAPSYAIWVQDEAGNTATLYATGKAATGLENRPGALPVWKGVSEADVTSGATPNKEADLTLTIPAAFAGKKLTLFIEANASFDYNDYYAKGLAESDEGYSDVNGQPSVVWTADIDTSVSGSATPVLAGTGEVLGADNELHDVQNLTTATELLTAIQVSWDVAK